MNAIDFTPFSFTPSQNEETNMYAPVTNFGWFVFFVFFSFHSAGRNMTLWHLSASSFIEHHPMAYHAKIDIPKTLFHDFNPKQ